MKTENYIQNILGIPEEEIKQIQDILFNITKEPEFIKSFNKKEVV